ncbi:hypothetical protein [Streptomyces sp. NBC_01500]|uniref:hypothetical protein n=1 Tax=Streptomyces sp. NBC_01500 TaxID=2903886 RepID=UPI002256A5CC|nr:hypothetical protein [Streptomyces sp. NBC_01500]MCX4552322.1 hypothetical protein [Streptomyces sp. NBC_01500]
MTLLHYGAGAGRRRLVAAAPEESLPQVVDAPIYQALVSQWVRAGRTLPGRRDQEWARLTAAGVRPGQFSATPDPRDGGR